ncbi:RDD family protein [Hymenobacter sp. BT175]|uniref:RDD family protein n=1 Tax=Hymenobacter translucens TaxID=2886507 RepID=UPI001D0EF1BB|nr:RDD family protein [Hymenobacter translucens]MCC2547074.1 RDD family protein [Hymenobacter translucens]
MNTIRIQTAQNVSVEYEVASVGDRIIATILDYLVMFGWMVVWVLILGIVLGGNGTRKFDSESSNLTIGVLGVLIIGVPFVFYHLVCEIFFSGQSLGKRARDIKVVRLDGGQPSVGDYLLRWLLRIVDTGIGSGVVAVITILLNGRGQRLGDLAAGTTVVRLRPMARPEPMGVSLTPPDYQVVFPEVTKLSDQDVAVLRKLLVEGLQRENYLLLNEAATRVKQLTGIHTDLADEPFLRTVLRDHAHLAATQ